MLEFVSPRINGPMLSIHQNTIVIIEHLLHDGQFEEASGLKHSLYDFRPLLTDEKELFDKMLRIPDSVWKKGTEEWLLAKMRERNSEADTVGDVPRVVTIADKKKSAIEFLSSEIQRMRYQEGQLQNVLEVILSGDKQSFDVKTADTEVTPGKES